MSFSDALSEHLKLSSASAVIAKINGIARKITQYRPKAYNQERHIKEDSFLDQSVDKISKHKRKQTGIGTIHHNSSVNEPYRHGHPEHSHNEGHEK